MNNKRKKIEDLLASGMRQKKIAETAKCSEAYVSKVKKKVKLVKKQVNSQVNLLTSSRIPSRPLAPSQLDASLRLRLHRFYYSVAILNALSEDRLRALTRNNRLNNITQWLGTGFRITQGTQNRTLEIEGLELYSDYRLPVALLEAQASTTARNACEAIAHSYGLLIAKEGYTPPKLEEIELSATQMTEKLREIEKKGIVPLYEDQNHYKIWVDWSYGIGGMESNSPVYLQRLSDFAKDLAERDGWQEAKADLFQAISLVKYYAENMEAHAKLVKQASTLIKELRHERKAMRKAELDRRQRRLL